MQPVEPLGHSVPGLGPAQTHKHKKLETIRVKNCNRSSWWFQFMTTYTTTTTYYMKTDEQLNDMTLVIVHSSIILLCATIFYSTVRLKPEKMCNSSLMFVLKAEVFGFQIFTCGAAL